MSDRIDFSDRPPVTRMLLGTSVVLVVITFVFGYVGFRQYVQPPYQKSFLDTTYYTLQLFVFGSDPLQLGGDIPPPLEVARFAAATVTLIALFETGRLLLTDRLRKLRISRRQGHVVICGESAVARALVHQFRAAGRNVVSIRPGETDHPHDVTGNATDPQVLRDAGVPHADVLYAASARSADNVAIAVAAARLADGRSDDHPLAVYAEVHDPELCVSLQARRLAVAQPPGLMLDFFNIDGLAARALFRTDPLDGDGAGPPRLLVAGGTPMAKAIVVEAGRQWRTRRADPTARLHVDYMCDEARAQTAVLRRQYPFIDDAIDTTPYGREVPFAVLVSAQSYDRVFLCYPDEEESLRLALTTNQLWHSGSRSVTVPLNELAELTTAFHGRGDAPLFDELNGALRLYPVVDAACDPDVIREDLIERLARLIHEHYLAGCRQRGDFMPAASMVDWSRLDEQRRLANRLQAADIGYKLQSIGCVLIPRVAAAIPFAFTDEEIEQLAEREHQRWKETQERQGWRLGREHDEDARRSPYFVDWQLLADDLRHKCRAAVWDLTVILADAGFDIVRVGEAPAPVPV